MLKIEKEEEDDDSDRPTAKSQVPNTPIKNATGTTNVSADAAAATAGNGTNNLYVNNVTGTGGGGTPVLQSNKVWK